MRLFPTLTLCATVCLAACDPPPDPAAGLSRIAQAEGGVPVDGYPNYHERLMLVAINRGRAEPNSVALGTAGSCGGNGSTPFAVSDPLVLNLAGSKAARFHCANCLLNDGGLSHDSYCTLKQDIAQTNCDGSLDCACEPGSDHFNCTTGGGHGTDPWGRTSRFGYSANGEVGAVGYSDGWEAVAGWITECPDYEGHRRILLDADRTHTQIGLGYAGGASDCWTRFYFGDTSGAGVATPRLPAGCHRPETGTNPSFYLNVYDPGGGAQSVDVVIDGACHAMDLEAGTPANGTYRAQVDVGSGCHQYWFLVRDGAGDRHTYPAAGAWGCGACTDYDPVAAEAGCETCADGETKPCGTDVGACQAGQQTCQPDGTWGTCLNAVEPIPEECNGQDDDCDGQLPADEADADGDGVAACAGDCDDGRAGAHPGAAEACNGLDDDCDGQTPADEADADGDGHRACAGDCDDADPAVNPDAAETCNGIDDNCDGATDEGCTCTDGQTRDCGTDEGACQLGRQTCAGGAWGDCQGGVTPVDEICNGADDDCDGQTDEGCQDDGGQPDGATDGGGADDGPTDTDGTPGPDGGQAEGPPVIEGGCACGPSAAHAGWPACLAVLVLLGRRRRRG